MNLFSTFSTLFSKSKSAEKENTAIVGAKNATVSKDVPKDSNCGLCAGIQDWISAAKKSAFSLHETLSHHKKESIDFYEPFPQPPDADQLGRETWTFLHTLAAYYPQNPTIDQQNRTRFFFELLASLYPCTVCAEHLKDELSINPPRVSSTQDLSEWLCDIHNEVNHRLGKPIFDCSKVLQRWKISVQNRVDNISKDS